MTDEILQPQFRRLSLYRQLSDVLKSKRKSSLHLSPPPPPSTSTSTFAWNCTLPEVNSPSKEELNIVSNHLIKQKSISCDDMAFLSSNEEQQTIDKTSEQNGLFDIFSFIYFEKQEKLDFVRKSIFSV